MEKLFISLPGQSDYTVFQKDSGGPEVFSFVSFDGRSRIEIPMSLTADESFQPYYNPLAEMPASLKKSEYLDLIADTIDYLRTEGMGKVVISRTECFAIRLSPVEVFQKLVQKYPSACVYLFTHPKAGTWMGATPELLLRSEAGEVKSMSLAGTRKTGEEESFSAKEEEEQQMVTDYIFKLFESEPGLDGVNFKPPVIQQAGNLVHFKTEFNAKSKPDFSVRSFLGKLHPTPAVGGFPKSDALKFIVQNEGYDRSFYAGYFGFSSGKDFQYYVNLRCMQLFTNAVVLYAGGGITADSEPDSEWQETVAKMETLLNVINNAG